MEYRVPFLNTFISQQQLMLIVAAVLGLYMMKKRNMLPRGLPI